MATQIQTHALCSDHVFCCTQEWVADQTVHLSVSWLCFGLLPSRRKATRQLEGRMALASSTAKHIDLCYACSADSDPAPLQNGQSRGHNGLLSTGSTALVLGSTMNSTPALESDAGIL
jgi:hypothetical protein